jgi:hypothetical protein
LDGLAVHDRLGVKAQGCYVYCNQKGDLRFVAAQKQQWKRREEKYYRCIIYILIVERRLMMLDAHTIAVREKGPLL